MGQRLERNWRRVQQRREGESREGCGTLFYNRGNHDTGIEANDREKTGNSPVISISCCERSGSNEQKYMIIEGRGRGGPKEAAANGGI